MISWSWAVFFFWWDDHKCVSLQVNKNFQFVHDFAGIISFSSPTPRPAHSGKINRTSLSYILWLTLLMSWFAGGQTICEWHDAWKRIRQRLMHFTLCRWCFENSVCWCSKRESRWDRCECKASKSPTPWSVVLIHHFGSHTMCFFRWIYLPSILYCIQFQYLNWYFNVLFSPNFWCLELTKLGICFSYFPVASYLMWFIFVSTHTTMWSSGLPPLSYCSMWNVVMLSVSL